MKHISAEKLKKQLNEKMHEKTKETKNKEIKKILEMVTKAVMKEIDKQPEVNPWITNRLPTKEERKQNYDQYMGDSYFIVTIKGAEKPTALWLEEDNTWVDDSGIEYKVEAWKLLPDVYKKVKEGK